MVGRRRTHAPRRQPVRQDPARGLLELQRAVHDSAVRGVEIRFGRWFTPQHGLDLDDHERNVVVALPRLLEEVIGHLLIDRQAGRCRDLVAEPVEPVVE